jgi:hypothetical protein
MPEKKTMEGKRKKNPEHPVKYSCACILYRSKHPKTREILALMEAEIAGTNTSVLTDWVYWAGRWGDLSIESRENLASREVLPAYLRRFGAPPADNARTLAPASEDLARSLPVVGRQSFDVGAVISGVMGSTGLSRAYFKQPVETDEEEPPKQEMLLDAEIMRVCENCGAEVLRMELPGRGFVNLAPDQIEAWSFEMPLIAAKRQSNDHDGTGKAVVAFHRHVCDPEKFFTSRGIGAPPRHEMEPKKKDTRASLKPKKKKSSKKAKK